MKFKVRRNWSTSDVVVVQAKSKTEAIKQALLIPIHVPNDVEDAVIIDPDTDVEEVP